MAAQQASRKGTDSPRVVGQLLISPCVKDGKFSSSEQRGSVECARCSTAKPRSLLVLLSSSARSYETRRPQSGFWSTLSNVERRVHDWLWFYLGFEFSCDSWSVVAVEHHGPPQNPSSSKKTLGVTRPEIRLFINSR